MYRDILATSRYPPLRESLYMRYTSYKVVYKLTEYKNGFPIKVL